MPQLLAKILFHKRTGTHGLKISTASEIAQSPETAPRISGLVIRAFVT